MGEKPASPGELKKLPKCGVVIKVKEAFLAKAPGGTVRGDCVGIDASGPCTQNARQLLISAVISQRGAGVALHGGWSCSQCHMQ